MDFKRGTKCIRQQLSKERGKGGKYYIATTKNNKTRAISPAPFVRTALKEVKREQAENKIRAGKAWENDWDLVFANEIGNYMVQQTVWTHFKKIVKSIGKPETRFHDLRHTYAVAALQEGDDVKTVQTTNLGHATASFTLDVYGHVSEKMKKDLAARMEAFMQNIKG